MRSDATYLGAVRRVVGAKVTVEVTPDLPSVSPVIDGRVHRVGQVGSFVRIPVGFLNLFGIVTMVGSTELRVESDPVLGAKAQRWLEIQLIGESLGMEGFQRGISTPPTLDDEVHILTGDFAGVIFGTTAPSSIPIGHHVAASNLTAYVDLNKVLTRHTCVVGATGSGKSNTVAHLLSQLATSTYPGAQIVVLDPHGEYGSAFPDTAQVFRIGDTTAPLQIPYWVMNFDEVAALLVDRKPGSEMAQDTALRDKVFVLKKEMAGSLQAGAVRPENITVDAPIPFDIRRLWYEFDRAERVTYSDKERIKEALVKEGDAASLQSAQFEPHNPYNAAPWKGNPSVPMAAYVTRIYNRLRDSRFEFLMQPGVFDGRTKDLDALLDEWLGHGRPITVFDLSNVPFEIMDLAIGTVSRLLFDACFWGRNSAGIGRSRPLMVVYEEAHAYLSRQATSQGYAKRAAQRILKEGRKYGIGAMVVSQRPSEVDETILSQCGTYIAMRLTNAPDQGQIRATVPDSMAGLLELLPALRTGEALVMGEAVEFPYRVKVELVTHRPDSRDPVVHERWSEVPAKADYAAVVTGWRTQQLHKG